ncbi:MAG: hypothetical protein MJK04_09195, partial [Psychrosphaera sp.]|nr:hypothetical protein [Psychrosphaera sp.]
VAACGAGPNPVCITGLFVLAGTALHIGTAGLLKAYENRTKDPKFDDVEDESIDFDPEKDTVVNENEDREGNPRIKIKRADGSEIDMTNRRVKKKVPEPRNPNGGTKDAKFDNSHPGSKGKKRDPTEKEKEFIEEHTTR